MQRYYLVLLAGILFITACSKKHSEPVMHYTSLNDIEMKYGQPQSIDINHDGQRDLYFSTVLVGDPVLKQDKTWFKVTGSGAALLINDQEVSPVLHKGDDITATLSGYEWWGTVNVILAEKITEENNNSSWQGLWKNASHLYLPVRVTQNNEPYYGWIELSFDTPAEKLILHQMAISTKANVPVKAGL